MVGGGVAPFSVGAGVFLDVVVGSGVTLAQSPVLGQAVGVAVGWGWTARVLRLRRVRAVWPASGSQAAQDSCCLAARAPRQDASDQELGLRRLMIMAQGLRHAPHTSVRNMMWLICV